MDAARTMDHELSPETAEFIDFMHKSLEFEEAAMWRDQLAKLRQMWTDRYGSRADAALKRVSAGKKRINRPSKKRI